MNDNVLLDITFMVGDMLELSLSLSLSVSLSLSLSLSSVPAASVLPAIMDVVKEATWSQPGIHGLNSMIPTAANFGRARGLRNAIVVIVIIIVNVLSQCDGCEERKNNLGEVHDEKDEYISV